MTDKQIKEVAEGVLNIDKYNKVSDLIDAKKFNSARFIISNEIDKCKDVFRKTLLNGVEDYLIDKIENSN